LDRAWSAGYHVSMPAMGQRDRTSIPCSRLVALQTPNSDSKFWILDSGLPIPDSGFWILDSGLWIMDYGLWIMDYEI
jgi:hypothetical protein